MSIGIDSQVGDALVKIVLLHEGQHKDNPAPPVVRPVVPVSVAEPAAWRELLKGVVIIVHGQSNLLEIVLALHAVGGFANLLHGGQQQAYQDGNDGNHHQQLDQGEAPARPPTWSEIMLRHTRDSRGRMNNKKNNNEARYVQG